MLEQFAEVKHLLKLRLLRHGYKPAVEKVWAVDTQGKFALTDKEAATSWRRESAGHLHCARERER